MLFLAEKISKKIRNVSLAFTVLGIILLVLAIAVWLYPQLIIVIVVAALVVLSLSSFSAAVKVNRIKQKVDKTLE